MCNTGFWRAGGGRNSGNSSEKAQVTTKTKANSKPWRWLRCGSVQEEVFWRSRLSTAFRTAWACLMAGIILQVGSMHVQWVTFPIFGYVMAVTVVGESTAGKAMRDALAIVTGTAQGIGISLVVLQLLPPASCFRNIGAGIGCIAITSFLVALPKRTPTTNILHKRVMLAHCAIVYVTAVVKREKMDSVLFPLQLAGTTIVGATCGALALVLPYPRFAISEIHSNTKLAARITSERLRAQIDAFSASSANRASALNLQAKALAKIASSVHSEIATIEDDMGWEIKRLPYTSEKLQYVTRGLSSVQRNLVGMELALQAESASSAGLSKQRRLIGRTMKDSLVYITDWVSLALKHASTDIKQYSAASHGLITEEGSEVLTSFNEALSYTNQQGTYALATEELRFINNNGGSCDSDDENHDAQLYGYNSHHDDADHDSNFSCSDSEMVETMCNAAKEQLEHRVATGDIGREDVSAILGDIPGNDGHHSAHVSANIIDRMRDLRCSGQNMGSSLLSDRMGALFSFGDQAAASFFLFNVKKFVQATRHLLETSHGQSVLPGALEQSKLLKVKVIGSASDTQNIQLQPTSHAKVLVSNSECPNYLPSCGLNPQFATGHKKTSPQEMFSAHNVSSPQFRKVQRLCKKCSANSSSSGCKLTKPISPNKVFSLDQLLAGLEFFKPNSQQLRTAFKLSLAMALGGFLGFWFNNSKGYWADITLALGYTGVAKGGSFKVAVLRTLGTVSGSIYGLMVVLATFNFTAMRFVALIPWVVFTSFLRQSKIFGYSGAVSAFTGAIVILARTNKDSTDEEFTVIRIVEAFLGMASFVIVELLVMPRRAASMVKPEIISGFSKLQEFITAICYAYSSEDCDVCSGSKIIEELKGKEEKLRKAMNSQNALVKEAAEEPQFWFAPFSEKIFLKVMEEQRNILEMLHFSVAVFEEIKQVTSEAKVPMDKLLQAPLKSAITMMEERVVPTLALLARALAVKAEEVLPMRCTLPVSDLSAKGTFNPDKDHKFVELESVMMSDSIMKNSSFSKHYPYVDMAASPDRRIIEAFEKGMLHVANELAVLEANMTVSPGSSTSQASTDGSSVTCPPQCFDTFSNTLFLSLGTLAFAMNRVLHHVTQLEKVVHELLQEENPWILIQFPDTSKPMGLLR
ncbi:hypothetical protein GOP47_0002610 [Adiantum capillus-veneris]|uniref:p-hydroxybenzoic acid efflux pump subunit aaeB n=1 Tax=Adiantum capillus-veneris TaxID=13818 RepID=A0A9D4ZRF0_ADICA|nr:hypothetical protein GOP47_0002610 [Adiantum capillus-veneris]